MLMHGGERHTTISVGKAACIQILLLKTALMLPLRALQGFIDSIFRLDGHTSNLPRLYLYQQAFKDCLSYVTQQV